EPAAAAALKGSLAGNLSDRELEAAAKAAKADSELQCVAVFQRGAVLEIRSEPPAAYVVALKFHVTGAPPSPTAMLDWLGLPNPWLDVRLQGADGPAGLDAREAVDALCHARQAPIDEAAIGGPRFAPWSEERIQQCRRFGRLRLVEMQVRLVGKMENGK
ncbi:MAG TPA: hypothetical protein VL860_09085, partial [Planctomycetota bacterium]|nr:hypothetical protein [Planctomycetota bacterium]